jgi:hypothetical protein
VACDAFAQFVHKAPLGPAKKSVVRRALTGTSAYLKECSERSNSTTVWITVNNLISDEIAGSPAKPR